VIVQTFQLRWRALCYHKILIYNLRRSTLEPCKFCDVAQFFSYIAILFVKDFGGAFRVKTRKYVTSNQVVGLTFISSSVFVEIKCNIVFASCKEHYFRLFDANVNRALHRVDVKVFVDRAFLSSSRNSILSCK